MPEVFFRVAPASVPVLFVNLKVAPAIVLALSAAAVETDLPRVAKIIPAAVSKRPKGTGTEAGATRRTRTHRLHRPDFQPHLFIRQTRFLPATKRFG
jgi:hypothetical protein